MMKAEAIKRAQIIGTVLLVLTVGGLAVQRAWNQPPDSQRGVNSAESGVWVVLRDLPAPTRDRLRARIAAGDAPADDGWLDGPATR